MRQLLAIRASQEEADAAVAELKKLHPDKAEGYETVADGNRVRVVAINITKSLGQPDRDTLRAVAQEAMTTPPAPNVDKMTVKNSPVTAKPAERAPGSNQKEAVNQSTASVPSGGK